MDKDILHEGEYFEEIPEESPLQKNLRRAYIIIVALFLILLLIINTNAGAHFISVLAGKIITSKLNQDHSFNLRDSGQVIFLNQTYMALDDLYEMNQKAEFKICLTGEKIGKNYYVSGMYIPKTYGREVYSVTAAMCSSETIISLHSHPYLHCIFSNQDIDNLRVYRQVNPDMILGVMCDRDKITFYGYS